MRTTKYKNIFREYNIPIDKPRNRKKKQVANKKYAKTNYTHEEDTIEHFSEDENISNTYPFIQLRRSFEIPLKLVRVERQNNSIGCSVKRNTTAQKGNRPTVEDSDDDPMPLPIVIKEILPQLNEEIQLPISQSTPSNISRGNTRTLLRSNVSSDESSMTSKYSSRKTWVKKKSTTFGLTNSFKKRKIPSVVDSDDDFMPLPIIIKEEILSQQNEELQIPISPSITSSDHSLPLLRAKVSSDESSVTSEDYSKKSLVKKNTSSSKISNSCKQCRKKVIARYRPLDITIVDKITTPASTSEMSRGRKGQTTKLGGDFNSLTQTNMNFSWSSPDAQPFQNTNANKSFLCSSPKPSQIIATPSRTPSPRKKPSELDLMIELIEQQNSVAKRILRKSPRKLSKRCLQGGHVEQYQRLLDKAKTDSKFLKHDKKFGLKRGVTLMVLGVIHEHGIQIAKVQLDDCGINNNIFAIVIPSHMANIVKTSSKIEAFFDESTRPYTIEFNGESLDVFIEPYKLLLL
ncbi:uncharacterized protein LOC106087736 [Stomoxys calcitrans]|uniref:uncharacterized protein LOC106087736 n=1 Tax=Stomoxys calcitrans TaxID=35570 RepID=UPI0027E33E9B|nr:uncharacterized protein LOC106087736 [Stomoxys calcitrans]